MKQSFTKIYEKERELLRKANSVSAYEVYFHLKNDNSYFKKEFMDLNRCIAEYLDYSIDTVKRAMAKLKDVGLIQTKKKGKVNYYILPYDSQNIEIITYKEEYDERNPVVQAEQPKEQECDSIYREPVISPTFEDVEQQFRKEDNIEEVEQPNERVDDGKFYTLFIAPSIDYWIHLYNNKEEKVLNNAIEQKAKYVSSLYPNINKDECYDKLLSYITLKQIS